jgi:hypothetical protein
VSSDYERPSSASSRQTCFASAYTHAACGPGSKDRYPLIKIRRSNRDSGATAHALRDCYETARSDSAHRWSNLPFVGDPPQLGTTGATAAYHEYAAIYLSRNRCPLFMPCLGSIEQPVDREASEPGADAAGQRTASAEAPALPDPTRNACALRPHGISQWRPLLPAL